MREQSYRLDPRIGWRVAASEGVAWNTDGARLAQRPGTIRPIDAPGGDLGGRAMPRRVAAGPGGQLYLITGNGTLLWYDPCRELFEPIPCAQGGRIGLADPFAIAVYRSSELLVLDRHTRMVTALSLADWRVKRQWDPFVTTGGSLHQARVRPGIEPLTGRPGGSLKLPPNVWDPRDIAVLPDGRIAVSERVTGTIAYLDWRGCLISAHDGATEGQRALRGPDAMAVSADGDLYVLEADAPAIAKLDAKGAIVARSEGGEGLPMPIEAATLAIDADGTIWVSPRLQGAARPHCCEPSGRISAHWGDPLVPAGCRVLAFDGDGRAILGTPRQPCLQRSDRVARLEQGSIAFDPLDSGRAGMLWDRARLELEIPTGNSVRLLAYASDAELDSAAIASLPGSAWISTPLSSREGEAVAAIRTAPGRYLWLRLEIAGDGIETPRLGAMVITYPRRSSARYLPAAWSSEPQSASFLNHFMMLFDEVRADVLEPLENLPALFDPMATPAAGGGEYGMDFLDWLAGWIGLALDRNWSVERRRRLVALAPSLFRIKGTMEGISRHVEIYTGIAPRIVEHYRLRRWMTLDESRLDGSEKLWGPDLVRRLELDGYAEIGRFALVDGGDPLTDPVAVFAHRATVYVPVSDSFSDADLAALEAVVEAARPAHVTVDVHVMRPIFVMGCETLLGVNTILGSGIDTAVTDESVLGDDIRLAGPPHAFSLAAGTRLGIDTTLE